MDESTREVHCAEIHGGNLTIDQGLLLPGLDCWAFSEPHGGAEEGGDVLFVSVCARGALSKLYLADVAGHGSSVAPLARILETRVREHLNDHDHRDFFRALNDTLEARTDLYATMVAVSYQRADARLIYAYAGHPRLLFRPAGERRFSALEPGYCPVPGAYTDLALGASGETYYDQSYIPFEVGDLAVLYSDGWVEARRQNGELVKEEGLVRIANAIEAEDAAGFRREFGERFRRLMGSEQFCDDISLLILRRTA